MSHWGIVAFLNTILPPKVPTLLEHVCIIPRVVNGHVQYYHYTDESLGSLFIHSQLSARPMLWPRLPSSRDLTDDLYK